MKIGENGIIVFKMYDLDMTAVNKLIFTFRGVEKIEKEYPSEYPQHQRSRCTRYHDHGRVPLRS